jgi:hypothetical protein
MLKEPSIMKLVILILLATVLAFLVAPESVPGHEELQRFMSR